MAEKMFLGQQSLKSKLLDFWAERDEDWEELLNNDDFDPLLYDEIIVGYPRTLRDIAEYYNVDYEELKEINSFIYAELYNDLGKSDPRAYLDFDKIQELNPTWLIFLPKGAILNHIEKKTVEENSSNEFESYFFKSSNNPRLLKVLKGEEQIEVGESDAPLRNESGSKIDKIDKSGRIYLLQYAMYRLQKLETSTFGELDGTFSVGGRLDLAISEFQLEQNLFPNATNNPERQTTFPGKKRNSNLLGIIDAKTLKAIDKELVLYENSSWDFNKENTFSKNFNPNELVYYYEKGSRPNLEKHWFKQSVLLGDFELLIFSHPSSQDYDQANVIELRLTYAGTGISSINYYSIYRPFNPGSYTEKDFTPYIGLEYRVPKITEQYDPGWTSVTANSPFIEPNVEINDSLPVIKYFGFRLKDSETQFHALDFPYEKDYSVSGEIEVKSGKNDKWQPEATVYYFNGTECVIIPKGAKRVGQVESPFRFDNGDDLNPQNSLLIAKDVLVELIDNDSEEKKGVGWMPSESYLFYPHSQGHTDEHSVQDVLYRIDAGLSNASEMESPQNAAALAETCILALDALRTLLIMYSFVPEKQKVRLDYDLVEVSKTWTDAIANVYFNPEVGRQKVELAQNQEDFVRLKMEGFELQINSGENARLNAAVEIYKGIKSEFGNERIIKIIDKELAYSYDRNRRNREQFFNPQETFKTDPNEQFFLPSDMVIGLIDMLAMNYLSRKIIEAKEEAEEGVFQMGGNFDYTINRLQTTGVSSAPGGILEGYDRKGPYWVNTVRERLDDFYTMIENEGFESEIEGLISAIESHAKLNTILGSLFTTVLAFVLAEILSAGLATPLVAGILGVSRVTKRGIRLYRLTQMTTTSMSFTYLSREFSKGTPYASENSFLADFLTNFIMFGFLGLNKAVFDNLVSASRKAGFVVTGTEELIGGQLTAIVSLTAFSEIHHITQTGKVMSSEERMYAFINNLGLHFAMQISGFLVNNTIISALDKVYNPIRFGSEKQRVFDARTRLEESTDRLLKLQQELESDGTLTKEFVNELAEHFKLENLYRDELILELQNKNTPEAEQQIVEINETSKTREQEFSVVVDRLMLQLELLGVDTQQAFGESSIFKKIGPKRLQIHISDMERVKRAVTAKDGLDAKWEPLQEGKVIKIITKEGGVLYLEITSTLGEGVIETANRYGLTYVEAQRAFWSEIIKKEGVWNVDLSQIGDNSIDLLIQDALTKDWKPGEPLPNEIIDQLGALGVFTIRFLEINPESRTANEGYFKLDPEGLQKAKEIELNIPLETRITGDYERHEAVQATEFGKEHGGGGMHFPKSEMGIEGVYVTYEGEALPVSFKNLTTTRVENVFRVIINNAKQVYLASQQPGTLAYRYCKIGDTPNTYLRIDLTSLTKEQILDYYNEIITKYFNIEQLLGLPGIFKEIKIIGKDGGEVVFENYKLKEALKGKRNEGSISHPPVHKTPQPEGRFFPHKIINGKIILIDRKFTSGWFDFVITESNKLRIGYGHYFLSEGGNVLSAGRVKLDNGKVKYIDNLSGHYELDPEQMMNNNVKVSFENNGIDISKTKFYYAKFDKNGDIIGWFSESGKSVDAPPYEFE